MGDKVSLYAVGDVCVNRENPESIFEHSITAFKEADILFGNCEAIYSDRGTRNLIARGASRIHPKYISGLKFAGFDVMSLANNMCLGWGFDALFDTLDLFKKNNIASVGVGKDIAEARKPVIVKQKNGPTVAFLAYASVKIFGYEADVDKPGCAPLTIYTHYVELEDEQPGNPPNILTFTDRGHLDAMTQDIKKAKSLADIVVISTHWGLHHVRASLAMYEKEIAHTAIDAGADLILGGHQHILKGIEFYKGKPVFYGLGNFAFDFRINEQARNNPRLRSLMERYPGSLSFQSDSPGYPFSLESRKTIIAKCILSGKQIERVSFLPVFINKGSQPCVLHRRDADFDKVAQYMADISKEAGFDTKFSVEGDDVVVESK